MILAQRKTAGLMALGALLSLVACGSGGEEELAGTEEAAVEEPAIIAVRQANFEEMGDAFKPIGDTLKSGEPDIALIGRNAEIIAANLLNIPDHFPAGTGMDDGYDTEALAAIWEKPDEFSEASDEAIAAGAALVEAANSGELSAVQAAVGALGNTCKNCHDTFREDT